MNNLAQINGTIQTAIPRVTNFVIRHYEEEDIPEMIELVKQFICEERVLGYRNRFFGIDFAEDKVYNLLKSRQADHLFFTNIVTNEEDRIIGGLTGAIHQPVFSRALIAQDYLLYLDPSFKSITALFALINSYVEWAEKEKAIEVQLSSSTGYNEEGFETLMRRCGFEQFGIGFSRRF